MSTSSRLGLFDGYGVEVEYMIVDTATLRVRPMADEVIRAVAGDYVAEVERGPLCWSNELMLHVIELKTNGPAATLSGAAAQFQGEVRAINRILQPLGARLMPTAMHPWMHPDTEARLWPHEYNEVFEAFDRVFDCSGHGWANIQSAHLNLPFRNDDEFGRLHAAVRVLLPLLPAMAASSPYQEGRRMAALDHRMALYGALTARIPSITGDVIPEPVYTEHAYQDQILARMYADIAPHDPLHVLQLEWLNSRGAIARFTRGSIEVRVVDTQECPAMDLAILALASETLRALVHGAWADRGTIEAYPGTALRATLDATTRDADLAPLDDPAYPALFGGDPGTHRSARDLIAHLYTHAMTHADAGTREVLRPLETILAHGALARRIVEAARGGEGIEGLRPVYARLADCLAEGRPFVPAG
jgi:gamma-glutamyl:cysteine ligase YbdK (ATP-grasp superfamily)